MNSSDANHEVRSADEIIIQINLLEKERIRSARVAAAHEATTNLKRSIEERELEKIAVEREYELKIQEIDRFTSHLRHHLLARQENEARGEQAEVDDEVDDEFEGCELNANGSSGGSAVLGDVGEDVIDEHLGPYEVGNAARMTPARNTNRGMTSTYPSPEPQELCSTLYSVDQPIKFGVASERDVAGIANSSIQTHKNLRDEQHEDQLSRKKQKRIEIESKTMTSSRALRPSISSRKGTSFPRDSTLSSLQSRRYSRIRKAPEVLADSSAEDEELILKQLAQHQEDDTGAVTRVIDSASSETIAGNAEGSD